MCPCRQAGVAAAVGLLGLVCGLEAAVLTVTVVENLTSRPLARARVTIEPNQGAPLTAVTGRGGFVTLPELAPGLYRVRAEREGFAPRSFGQRRFGEPGTPIVLEADSHFTAELRLERLGAVSGLVVDENEVGLAGVPVAVVAAGSPWKVAATSVTDDRGQFRIWGLRPGRYLVRTAAKRLADGSGLLPTYYGQTASASRAIPVMVRLDEEVRELRIQALSGRLARLSGRVSGGTAERVVLTSQEHLREVTPAPDGRFEFGELEPGAYELTADGAGRFAWAEIHLGEQDRAVNLELGPAPVVEVRCASQGDGQADLSGLSVFARRHGAGQARRLQCGEATAWEAGRWELGVASAADRYVAAIVEAESGSALAELLLRPGERRTLTVLLGGRPASLEVRVRTPEGIEAAGALVGLRAVDPDLGRRVGGVRTARADREGRAWFAGLPPGRYEVVSSYQLEEMAAEDWPAGGGTPIWLQAGQAAKLELGLTVIE